MAEAQSTASHVKKKSDKPKYTHLSLADKCTIIRRLEAGETNNQLAKEYGVVHSAISYIKKNKENIYAQRALLGDQQGSELITRFTLTGTSALEQGIYQWFCQKRSLGEPISVGPMLRKKALLYNEKLGGPSTFQASNGWIQRFKTRHGIHELSMRGEKLSVDAVASSAFVTDFSRIIKEGNYSLDNIYNANQTGLLWKSLPRKTAAAENEAEVAGPKVWTDRVTVLACGNASGTHRIPLLVIGKSKKPKSLKDAKVLPVNYCGQPNAWMDRQIFYDWYKTIFLPAIKERSSGDDEKFLLLLDNAPPHSSAEELNSIDESCRVIFLPLNVAALIQPMDQGVMKAITKDYKKSLVRKLLLEEDFAKGDTVTNFFRKWNILNCCETIAQAWDNLSEATMRNAWKNILSPNNTNSRVAVVQNCELTRLINRIPGYENCTDEQTTAWLEEDSLEPVWHVSDDDELLDLDEPAESSMHDSQEYDDDENRTAEDLPTPREVLKSLDTVLRWYRTRWESEVEHLSLLYKIRQLVENLILNP